MGNIIGSYFAENYAAIIIGIIFFQWVYTVAQYIITKRLEFLYFAINLTLGIYIAINEITGNSIALGVIDRNNFLISAISTSLIFYWLFFKEAFSIRSSDIWDMRIIYVSVGLYSFALAMEMILNAIQSPFYGLALQISGYITYIPMFLSFILYYRMYKSRDKLVVGSIVIGSVVGDMVTFPLQLMVSKLYINLPVIPYFTIAYVFESFFYTFGLTIKTKRLEKEKSNLQNQLLQSQLSALRSQMNPHFFHNALNVINRFVLNDENETASFYLTKFSRLTRDILRHSRSDSISLREELDLISAYVEMEQLRFSDKFSFRIESDERLDLDLITIPPMMIQPLVENAILHGLLRKKGDKSLVIQVSDHNQWLTIKVVDNGIGIDDAKKNGKAIDQKKDSYALDIIKDRLQLINSKSNKAQSENEPYCIVNSSKNGTEITINLAL